MTTTTPVPEATLLPTPCRENHASFLAVLPDGSLGCAWFGGSREGRPDVSIYFSRWNGEEAGWSEPVQVSHDQERSEQNPVIVVQDDGALWLLYTSQELGSQDTSVVKGQRSSDLGATWSAAETVLGQPGTFIRQGLVVGQDGSWRLPIFHCGQVPGRPWTGDCDTSAVAVSTDRGATWSEHPVPDSLGEVHMALVPLRDGTTAGFFRSRWADAVHRSTSTDGITFTAPEPVDVPNGNVSIAVLRVPETDLLVMACNPVAAAEGASYLERTDEDEEGKAVAPGQRQKLDRYAVWSAPRVPLALFSSRDGGLTWRREVDIASPEGVGPGGRRPEMSYPSLAVDPAGDLHVSWSHHRIGIGWTRVPAATLDTWACATG